MISEEDYLQISGIQHFLFCPRQWGLIHIENIWFDNLLTAEGQVMHQRVHDVSLSEKRKDIIVMRAISVKSSRLGASGSCDAVEFRKSESGIALHGYGGHWLPVPIEYKHGSEKTNDCDRAQVTAQAICLSEMFCIPINYGEIFYHETRRRERIEITDELKNKVVSVFGEMHRYMKDGHTPRHKFFKGCNSCSLFDYCMPKTTGSTKSVDSYIMEHIDEA